MVNNKFCGNDTFEEWAIKQDKDSLEFQIIKEAHDNYPNWGLQDIKNYVPGFLSRYMKLMQDVGHSYRELNIGETEKFISDYVTICKKSNDIHIEIFGSPPANVNQLSNWNRLIGKISKIIFHNPNYEHRSGYKPKDEKGFSFSYKTRIAGKTYSIRAEEQLGRDIGIIRSDHKHRFQTESDLLRELIFKGIEMYTLVNYESITGARDILYDMEENRLKEERSSIEYKTYSMTEEFSDQYNYLQEILRYRNESNRKGALVRFRDKITIYIEENLSFVGNIETKHAISEEIMENKDLDRILYELEREKLISREYVNDVKKGIPPPPSIRSVSDEDVKLHGNHD